MINCSIVRRFVLGCSMVVALEMRGLTSATNHVLDPKFDDRVRELEKFWEGTGDQI